MTAMEWGKDNSERFRQLTAQIASERDHDKFSALVKELNELLEGEAPPKESPKETGLTGPYVYLPSL
jgi:hypothetical protein